MHSEINYWQLQEAKARLSELVRLAMTDGPQGNIRDCILFQLGQQRPEILTGLEPEPALPRACNGVVDGAG